MYQVETKSEKRDKSLDFLKIFFAFEVFLVHGWSEFTYIYVPGQSFPYSFFNRMGLVAVPGFVLISFMLTDIHRMANDRTCFKKRIFRLIIPHIVWTLIYFGVYTTGTIAGIFSIPVTVKELFIQMFTATGYNAVMWFQIALIIITLILTSLSRLTGGGYVEDIFWVILFWLCIIGQYSGINDKIWSNFSLDLWKSYGRICEVMPIAIVGAFVQKYHIISLLKHYWLTVTVALVMGLITIYQYPVFAETGGDVYNGFWKSTMAALIVFIFVCIPKPVINKKAVNVVTIMAIATPGVYYMQRLVLTIFVNRDGTHFRYCCIIFAMMLIISIGAYVTKNKFLRIIFT